MSLDKLFVAALSAAQKSDQSACKNIKARKPKAIAHKVPGMSLQAALDKGYFGPVWHGSSESNRQRIANEGFKIIKGLPRAGEVSNGLIREHYGNTGKYPPIQFLGWGVYFTTSKTVAKQFNVSSIKGLITYFLDVPRLATINFGAPNTMMKWWEQNGFDSALAAKGEPGWIDATNRLTKTLSSQYDAVWFKGKGMYRLLDGDQIIVFDPRRIHRIDQTLTSGIEVGLRVCRKSDGMTGQIMGIRAVPPEFVQKLGRKRYIEIKWKVGGLDYNVSEDDIVLLD